MPPEWFMKTVKLIVLPTQVYAPPPFFLGSKILPPFRYPLYWNPNAESIIINFQITKNRSNFFNLKTSILLNNRFWTSMCACSVTESCPTLCDPVDFSLLSMKFSRQEYWEWVAIPFSRSVECTAYFICI